MILIIIIPRILIFVNQDNHTSTYIHIYDEIKFDLIKFRSSDDKN